jgi:hypothetical protein
VQIGIYRNNDNDLFLNSFCTFMFCIYVVLCRNISEIHFGNSNLSLQSVNDDHHYFRHRWNLYEVNVHNLYLIASKKSFL